MALRIDTPMAQARPVEATADKAHAMSRQGINTAAMKQEERTVTEKELQRPQAAEELEGRIIQKDESKKGGQGRQDEPGENEPEKELSEEDRLRFLKRRASNQLLNLSIEPEKKAERREHRIDIKI